MTIPAKTWVKPSLVSEGRHSGEIFHLEEREIVKGSEKYSYLDISIRIEDMENKPELKLSVPNSARISEYSKLGKLLVILGSSFSENDEVDVEKFLIGKKLSFLVRNVPSKDGKREYSEIDDESIKAIA